LTNTTSKFESTDDESYNFCLFTYYTTTLIQYTVNKNFHYIPTLNFLQLNSFEFSHEKFCQRYQDFLQENEAAVISGVYDVEYFLTITTRTEKSI